MIKISILIFILFLLPVVKDVKITCGFFWQPCISMGDLNVQVSVPSFVRLCTSVHPSIFASIDIFVAPA